MKHRSVRQCVVLIVSIVCLLCISCLPAHAQSSGRKLIKRVEPVYPELLRDRGIRGTVRLKVTVRPDGTIRAVEVEGGNPILADSAVRAVKLWRYEAGEGESTADVVIHFGDTKQ